MPSNQKKKNHSFFYFMVPFMVTILLFGVAGFLAKDFLLAKLSGDESTPYQSDSQVSQNLPKDTVLKETARAGDDYLNDIIFVGDSRTNGMANFGFVDKEQVFAVDGINHKDIQSSKFITVKGVNKTMTLEEGLMLKRPPIVMVSLGINGVAFMAEEEFIEEYRNLIELIQQSTPDSQVIIQSILPVSYQKEQSDTRMRNAKIDSYNGKLLLLAKETGCYYLDSAQALKNSKNMLDTKYDSGDGLHLNQKAYEVLFSYIMTHALYI